MEQDEVKSVNVLETPCLNSSFAEDDTLRSFGLGKTFFFFLPRIYILLFISSCVPGLSHLPVDRTVPCAFLKWGSV